MRVRNSDFSLRSRVAYTGKKTALKNIFLCQDDDITLKHTFGAVLFPDVTIQERQ